MADGDDPGTCGALPPEDALSPLAVSPVRPTGAGTAGAVGVADD